MTKIIKIIIIKYIKMSSQLGGLSPSREVSEGKQYL